MMQTLVALLRALWAQFIHMTAPWLRAMVRDEIQNDLFNRSEKMMREMNYPDLDEKVNLFVTAARKNPALWEPVYRSSHPWMLAYEMGKQLSQQGPQP